MPQDNNHEASLHGFIKNPQVHGVWCLRAHFNPESRKKLFTLLNLAHPTDNPYRKANTIPEEPPLVLLRLFAYLRALSSKPARKTMRPLFPGQQSSSPQTLKYSSRLSPLRRNYYLLNEASQGPTNLGTSKRKSLEGAYSIYMDKLSKCACFIVPQNPTKLDFLDRSGNIYFQSAEDPSGAIRIYSPHQDTIQVLMSLLGALSDVKVGLEVTKQFSPEEALMEMYIPVLRSLPVESILWDNRTTRNIHQALEDLREERFVHAIRAIGISIEELFVEIYETYLREKAPGVPLGSLLNDFLNKSQEIVQGPKKKQDLNVNAVRKELGKVLEAEKGRALKSDGVIALLDVLQKSVLPILDELGGTLAAFKEQIEELALEGAKT
ncbi:MAG: hypothetical protein EOP04_26925, partial [Proteobacteria bacterium]